MEHVPGKKIKITMDGPYEVTGDVPLDQAVITTDGDGMSDKWTQGKTYQTKDEPYNLCRCGHSHDKPFCDGSHDDAGFCGHEKSNRPPYARHAQIQEGATVDLIDDPSLCVGARFCDKGETVWGYVETSDRPGHKEMAIREACDCPAGRLTVVEKDGTAHESKLDPRISAVEDPINDCRGPLWVKGGIEMVGNNGEKYETRNRVALCRCGDSHNQPYCDGSHYNCRHMQGLDR